MYKVKIAGIAELTEEVTKVEIEFINPETEEGDTVIRKPKASVTVAGRVLFDSDKRFMLDSTKAIADWSRLKPGQDGVYQTVSIEITHAGRTITYEFSSAFDISFHEQFDEQGGTFELVMAVMWPFEAVFDGGALASKQGVKIEPEPEPEPENETANTFTGEAGLANESTGTTTEGSGGKLKVIDGKVGGKVPIEDYDAIRISSIKNPNSDILTLGKYKPTIENGVENWKKPGPDSYIAKAGETSYFDLGSEYNVIKDKYGLTDSEMFDYFNKPVLDDAIAKGKTIRFSHNPLETRTGALFQEWNYIKSNLGVTDANLVYNRDGDYWYVK